MSLLKRKADSPLPAPAYTSALITSKGPRAVSATSSSAVVSSPSAAPRTSSLAAPIMLLTGHESEVYTAKFSPDGRHLASGGFDRLIYLWNTHGETCDNYAVLKGSMGPVLDLVWAQDGQSVVSACVDGFVSVWDTLTGERIKKLRGHDGSVNSIGASIKGSELFVSCGEDGKVCLWDLRDKHAVQTIQDKYPLTACTFGPDGQVMSGGLDNKVKAWDLRKVGSGLTPGQGMVHEFKGHQDTITCLRVLEDRLLSNSMDNTIKLWDLKPFVPAESTRLIQTLYGCPHGFAQNLIKSTWSPDGDFIASGSGDRSVVVWNARTGAIVYKLPGHKGVVNEVCWSPKEPVLASCSSDKTIFLGEVNPSEVK